MEAVKGTFSFLSSLLPPIPLSVRPSFCLSIYLSIHLSIHPSVCVFIHPSIHLSICLSFIYLSVYLIYLDSRFLASQSLIKNTGNDSQHRRDSADQSWKGGDMSYFHYAVFWGNMTTKNWAGAQEAGRDLVSFLFKAIDWLHFFHVSLFSRSKFLHVIPPPPESDSQQGCLQRRANST